MDDNILLQFLASIIIGIIGIIPSCILRFGFKVKFSRKKAAFMMIPIALISIGILTCLFYAFGFEIKNFSLISLFIMCFGTFQMIYEENNFGTSSPTKNEVKEKVSEGENNSKEITSNDFVAVKESNSNIFNNFVCFLKNNWFKIAIIIILLLIYFKICDIATIIDDANRYQIELLEKIESSLDGFYSDWFGSQG